MLTVFEEAHLRTSTDQQIWREQVPTLTPCERFEAQGCFPDQFDGPTVINFDGTGNVPRRDTNPSTGTIVRVL
jgi:hypothetical protein